MEGFTRVLFANLCRLCAMNRPEGRVNIFDEIGEQLNLQQKLQALNIQVTIDDDLPKVVCSHCVAKLEDLHQFWGTCQSSTVLLNTFYSHAKDQEFFKTTGLVYISDSHNPQKSRTVPKLAPKTNKALDKLIKVENIEHRVPEACTDCTNQNTSETNQTKKAKVKAVVMRVPKNPLTSTATVTTTTSTVKKSASAGSSQMPALQYVCPDCAQTFHDRNLLLRHLRMHAIKMIQCELCARTFRRRQDHDKHMSMHRRKGEAPTMEVQTVDDQPARVLQTLTGFRDAKRLEPIITKSQRRDGKVEQL